LIPEDTIEILRRHFLLPARAESWAAFFNRRIKDPNVWASVYMTWYGARVVVWAREDFIQT
jgi:hypothetical protein